MIEAMGAMWQPVVNGVDDTDFWKDPVNAGWLANSKNWNPVHKGIVLKLYEQSGRGTGTVYWV